jgi:hypothetical protein
MQNCSVLTEAVLVEEYNMMISEGLEYSYISDGLAEPELALVLLQRSLHTLLLSL